MSPPRFSSVFCSQCGRTFGAADHGYSSCRSHRGLIPLPVWLEPTKLAQQPQPVKAA